MRVLSFLLHVLEEGQRRDLLVDVLELVRVVVLLEFLPRWRHLLEDVALPVVALRLREDQVHLVLVGDVEVLQFCVVLIYSSPLLLVVDVGLGQQSVDVLQVLVLPHQLLVLDCQSPVQQHLPLQVLL